ncbi:hypothetical protein AArcMg_2502 [Natrarchaeobaculum sulfurireducens]|uniref:Peptidoglycan/xylan/chitin deacetylase n=1 Tax=Natrarchaeobaculum sulfurireducens TaxID=2044521 RepID=A0A346PSJ8_9EURY|nr:Peptidoglycan/xylan/chitin deacetylase [Natrarchaeobaculum sulfurireducens]AXR82493.1 hypothetical protein AArcMg_2502 [Natrarchaeobaculum sulfurireducens]
MVGEVIHRLLDVLRGVVLESDGTQCGDAADFGRSLERFARLVGVGVDGALSEQRVGRISLGRESADEAVIHQIT